MKNITKRKGHEEAFDEKKIYASVYAACKSLRMDDEEIEMIATMVSHEMKDAMEIHKAITANELRGHVAASLKKYHPEAAYLYKSHKEIS